MESIGAFFPKLLLFGYCLPKWEHSLPSKGTPLTQHLSNLLPHFLSTLLPHFFKLNPGVTAHNPRGPNSPRIGKASSRPHKAYSTASR